MIGKAAVIGATGYVGGYLFDRLGPKGVGTYTGHPRAGLAPFDISRDGLGALQADGHLTHIIVAGGLTNPERCAREPEFTRSVNVAGTTRLLAEAMEIGLTPVFLSTDYVFRGDAGGYREEDAAAPTTEYGRQKAEVEAWLKASGTPFVIARLSKVVGLELNMHSVIGQWVAEIKAGKPIRSASDQEFSPAFAGDIARAIVDLCEAGNTGVWHVAGPAPVSRYGLARLLATEIARVDPSVCIDLSACRLSDIPFAEERPLRTWLDVRKLVQALPWQFRTMHDLCAEAALRYFG